MIVNVAEKIMAATIFVLYPVIPQCQHHSIKALGMNYSSVTSNEFILILYLGYAIEDQHNDLG